MKPTMNVQVRGIGSVQRIVYHSFLAAVVFLVLINFYINVLPGSTQDDFVLESTSLRNHSLNSSYLWHRTTLWPQLERQQNASTHSELRMPTYATTKSHSSTAPTISQPVIVWPNLSHYWDDRILAQLDYIPANIREADRLGHTVPMKKILLYHGYKDWDVKPGQDTFLDQSCPVNRCIITDNVSEGISADAVLFRQTPKMPRFPRPPTQIWILYLLESPHFTPYLHRFRNRINWVASYRHDSDIVTPYEKYVVRPHSVQKIQKPLSRNYAAGKTEKVAWFVSNCNAMNQRMEYVKVLSKYIQVDIFGKCGNKKCPRGRDSCVEMLNKHYKFYLAFENSNCRDYITEKFFVTGLQNDVVPVVMGAAPEDYERVAPHNSYIHVDQYTMPRTLAEYLLELDKDDSLYNEYFRWKSRGSFINTFFWCRLCSMLHDNSRPVSTYTNLEEWWRGKDVCIGKHSWGERPRNTRTYISDYYRNPHKGLV